MGKLPYVLIAINGLGVYIMHANHAKYGMMLNVFALLGGITVVADSHLMRRRDERQRLTRNALRDNMAV